MLADKKGCLVTDEGQGVTLILVNRHVLQVVNEIKMKGENAGLYKRWKTKIFLCLFFSHLCHTFTRKNLAFAMPYLIKVSLQVILPQLIS